MQPTRFAFCLLMLLAVGFVPACKTTTADSPTTATEAGRNLEAPKVPEPDQEMRPRDFYLSLLAQLPLRIRNEYQDFSGSDTVDKNRAWMTGLFYFYSQRQGQPDTRDLYAVFANNDLYRIRADDMSLDWTVNLEAQPVYDPVVSENYVFWVTRGPRVVWYYRDGQPTGRQKRWEEILHVKPTSPPACNDGGIYFGTGDYFRVYGFTSEFERELWFWPVQKQGTGRVAMQPFADNDRIYFYSENGRFYSVNTADGKENWMWPRDGEANVTARPTLKHNTLFIGSWDTNLYALDKSSKVVFTYPSGEPVVSTPFVEDYYILFQTPTRLVCVKAEYNDAGDGKTWLRPVNEDKLKAGQDRPDEPHWSVPLVPESMADMRADSVLKLAERRKFRELMKGREWIYLVETVGEKRYLMRIHCDTGRFDSAITPDSNVEQPRRWDITAFPYVVANDDENNRTLYFGTYEGYIFALRE